MSFYRLKKGLTAFGGVLALVFLGFPLIQNAVPDDVRSIFSQNCATAGCHYGRFPAMNLVLEGESLSSTLVDMPSRELADFMLVDTKIPGQSYLWLKLTGDERIDGEKMPIGKSGLSSEELTVVLNWIRRLAEPDAPSVTFPGDSAKAPPSARNFSRPEFWGTQVINLPTPLTVGRGDWLLRISHRFTPSTRIGWDGLFGLDGPAVILFGLGYGLTDTLDLTFSRSKLYKELDLAFKWRFLPGRMSFPLPLTASVSSGGSLITEPQAGEKILRSQNLRWNIQLSFAYQVTDAFSLLAVPAFSSNTEPREPGSQGTFVLGLAARCVLFNELSLLAEWTPLQTGYQTDFSGWGFGLEKKIGGHVFQVFVLNSVGITPAQFLPGGNLRIKDGDFRLGFNIFRTF